LKYFYAWIVYRKTTGLRNISFFIEKVEKSIDKLFLGNYNSQNKVESRLEIEDRD